MRGGGHRIDRAWLAIYTKPSPASVPLLGDARVRACMRHAFVLFMDSPRVSASHLLDRSFLIFASFSFVFLFLSFFVLFLFHDSVGALEMFP